MNANVGISHDDYTNHNKIGVDDIFNDCNYINFMTFIDYGVLSFIFYGLTASVVSTSILDA